MTRFSIRTLLLTSAVALLACTSANAEQVSAPRSPRNLYLDAIPDKFFRDGHGFWVFPHLAPYDPQYPIFYYGKPKVHDYANAVECVISVHKGVGPTLEDCKKQSGWPSHWPTEWPSK